MDIVCDTQTNDLLHDRFICSKLFLLYNGCLKTVQINNQAILQFVNIWSKKVPVNISYPSTVNKVDRYLEVRISPTSVRYNLSRDKQLNNKNNKRNRSQGGSILRVLRKRT